jgi:hypothetical protein
MLAALWHAKSIEIKEKEMLAVLLTPIPLGQ